MTVDATDTETLPDVASEHGLALSELAEDIETSEAALGERAAERAALQRVLDAATLKSDPLELAKAKIRLGLLDQAIQREQAALAPLYDERERLQTAYNAEQNRLAAARRIIERARTLGLKDPRKQSMQLHTYVHEIERAKRVLEAADETVEPIRFEI